MALSLVYPFFLICQIEKPVFSFLFPFTFAFLLYIIKETHKILSIFFNCIFSLYFFLTLSTFCVTLLSSGRELFFWTI